MWVFCKEKEGGTQLPICLPSSSPTPGSQRLGRLRLSFLSLEWGWALCSSPSHGLGGAACEQLCPVLRAVSLCCGLKSRCGSCLFHHSLAHLYVDHQELPTPSLSWQSRVVELGWVSHSPRVQMSALVAQLVIRPPHAHCPVPQGRSACPEVPSFQWDGVSQTVETETLLVRIFWQVQSYMGAMNHFFFWCVNPTSKGRKL